MEIIVRTENLESAADLTYLLNEEHLGGNAKRVWDSLSEEEQEKAFDWIVAIFCEDEPMPDFDHIWDYISLQLEEDRDKLDN